MVAGQIKLRWASTARSCVLSDNRHHGHDGSNSVAETLVKLVYRVVRTPASSVETETSNVSAVDTGDKVTETRVSQGDSRVGETGTNCDSKRWRRHSCSVATTTDSRPSSFSSLRRTLLSGVLGRVTTSQVSSDWSIKL